MQCDEVTLAQRGTAHPTKSPTGPKNLSVTMPQENTRDRLLVAKLPALPHALIKLLALCQSDDAGMTELTNLIAVEPTLSSRLLTVAHSAAYHHGDARLSLLQAANTLGTDMIKVLAISESVIQTFGAFSPTGSFDLRAFWKHSLSCAVVAKALAQPLNYPFPDEAYLAGLLHDVGRLALLACAPNACQAHFVAADNAALCDKEHDDLEMSHTEAGAWLLAHWHLPASMADAVLHHHAPIARVATLQPLPRLLHLAHQLLEWTPTNPGEHPDLDTGGALTSDELARILTDATLQVERTASDLGLDISDTDLPSAVVPPRAPDPIQDQLAQEMRNRSLLTEMSHQLTQHASVAMLLTSVRQHAGILLGLDDALVLLLGEDQHTLESVSVAPRHLNLATLTIDSRDHPMFGHCLQRHHLAVSDTKHSGDAELCQLLGSPQLVALPLLTAKRVLGVLLAAVPAAQKPRLQTQSRFLLAFGLHAGAALSRHLQTAQALDARIASIKREQLVNARQLVHEVNNPVSIIKNTLEIINMKLGPQTPVQDELVLVGQEISRVGGIVAQFSEGADAPLPEPVNLSVLVPELMHLLHTSRFIPAAIELKCAWPAAPCVVLGSPGMVKQILINLIKNARNCMPTGGVLTVSGGARVTHLGKTFVTLHVSDTGPRLDDKLLAQLFQPVTSDNGGKYHGLGLSVVHQLVTKMQGHISYRSGPSGVVFDILLPQPDQPG